MRPLGVAGRCARRSFKIHRSLLPPPHAAPSWRCALESGARWRPPRGWRRASPTCRTRSSWRSRPRDAWRRPRSKNRADAILAAHKPLAQWAVEGVLLSSDLVPHLLAPLRLEDGAAAGGCSRWAEGWKAISEGRQRLTRVALDIPDDLLHRGTNKFDMAVVPGGHEQLVVRSFSTVRMLRRDMSIISSCFLPTFSPVVCSIAASEEFIYAILNGGDYVARLTHDGTEVAYWKDSDKSIAIPVLAPGGLLCCVLYVDGTARSTRSSPSTPRRCSPTTGLGCQCSMVYPH